MPSCLLRCVICREGRAFFFVVVISSAAEFEDAGLLLSPPSLRYTNTFVAVLPHMTRRRRYSSSNTPTYSKPRRLLSSAVALEMLSLFVTVHFESRINSSRDSGHFRGINVGKVALARVTRWFFFKVLSRHVQILLNSSGFHSSL